MDADAVWRWESRIKAGDSRSTGRMKRIVLNLSRMPDKKNVSWWISTPNGSPAVICICYEHAFGNGGIREKRRNALTKHVLMLKWTYMTVCSCEIPGSYDY